MKYIRVSDFSILIHQLCRYSTSYHFQEIYRKITDFISGELDACLLNCRKQIQRIIVDFCASRNRKVFGKLACLICSANVRPDPRREMAQVIRVNNSAKLISEFRLNLTYTNQFLCPFIWCIRHNSNLLSVKKQLHYLMVLFSGYNVSNGRLVSCTGRCTGPVRNLCRQSA